MKINDISTDSFLEGRVRLEQWRRGHRAGLDAVLLARHALPFAQGAVADFGAGSGAVALMLTMLAREARYAPFSRLVLVEIHPHMAELARRNLESNGVAGEVLELDLCGPGALRYQAGLEREGFDLIVTNPPYHETGMGHASPDPARALAHTLPENGLSFWLRACADALKPGGRLVMIHRADRLLACFDALKGRFGALTLTPVHSRPDVPATRLLLHAVKGHRGPLKILPGFVFPQNKTSDLIA
jgi:tRNA1(Val) A37 N6-methylase TrmN6